MTAHARVRTQGATRGSVRLMVRRTRGRVHATAPRPRTADGCCVRGRARRLVGAGGGGDDVHVRRELLGQEVRQHLVVRAMLGQRTKDATSTVPGSGSSEDDDAVCVDATSCTANHYLSGGECVSCPTFDDKESTSASASSTTCTCPAGYYADKTTSCKACPVGSSRTGSTIFGDSEKEDDSVCVANCASGKYWDGDSCEDCPDNSVGAGGAATTCTCAANYWAKKSGSTWSCELMLRSKNQGCDLDGSRFRLQRG